MKKCKEAFTSRRKFIGSVGILGAAAVGCGESQEEKEKVAAEATKKAQAAEFGRRIAATRQYLTEMSAFRSGKGGAGPSVGGRNAILINLTRNGNSYDHEVVVHGTSPTPGVDLMQFRLGGIYDDILLEIYPVLDEGGTVTDPGRWTGGGQHHPSHQSLVIREDDRLIWRCDTEFQLTIDWDKNFRQKSDNHPKNPFEMNAGGTWTVQSRTGALTNPQPSPALPNDGRVNWVEVFKVPKMKGNSVKHYEQKFYKFTVTLIEGGQVKPAVKLDPDMICGEP